MRQKSHFNKILLILSFLSFSILNANDIVIFNNINADNIFSILNANDIASFNNINTDNIYRILPKYFFAYAFLLSSLFSFLFYKFISKRNNNLILKNKNKTYIDFEDSQDFSKSQGKLILILLFFMSIFFISFLMMILDYFLLDTILTSKDSIRMASAFIIPRGSGDIILFSAIFISTFMAYRTIKNSPKAIGLILFTYITIMVFILSFTNQIIAQNSGLIVATTMLFITLVVALNKYKKFNNFDTKIFKENIDMELLEDKNISFERSKIKNIVEEMSIASSMKIPNIYIIKSDTINSMITKDTSTNFSIAITQGAIDTLNREELQGMIAHHFGAIYMDSFKISSYIDCCIDGITFITNDMINIQTSENKSTKDIIFIGPMLIFTLLILISTYIVKLIQNSFYKEQKYLFDSYSVEFTRNDDSILNALKSINEKENNSIIFENEMDICTKLFFVRPNKEAILFEYYPKIKDRIIALEPK
jgi:heat shock protein HtpX